MSAVHLDDFTLAALALGDLPPSAGADARAHLDGCTPCASRFFSASAEADVIGDPGEQALQAYARPAPVQLLEVARPDGGAVLLFPARAQGGEPPASGGVGRLAARVFGRFEQLLHAAAGVPERSGDLGVASGEVVHSLIGRPGETLEVWFGNPHPSDAWLTVLRQQAGARAAPEICDGPRPLPAGRNAGEPTRLAVADAEQIVVAVLTQDRPARAERLREALALGLFSAFDEARPLGQVVCRIVTAKA